MNREMFEATKAFLNTPEAFTEDRKIDNAIAYASYVLTNNYRYRQQAVEYIDDNLRTKGRKAITPFVVDLADLPSDLVASLLSMSPADLLFVLVAAAKFLIKDATSEDLPSVELEARYRDLTWQN